MGQRWVQKLVLMMMCVLLSVNASLCLAETGDEGEQTSGPDVSPYAYEDRFNCSHEGYHLHTMTCFPIECSSSHKHVTNCYNMHKEPVCGIESETHEYDCLTEEHKQNVLKYNSGAYTVGGKIKADGPYIFSEIETYQMSTHVIYNNRRNKAHTTQLFLMANVEGMQDGETWKSQPEGKRYDLSLGVQRNFAVAYCCDMEKSVVRYTMYRALNLEDSGYYSADSAKRIRSVVMNSYPYHDLETMRERLAAAGIEDAQLIDESVLLVATQLAVWSYSNSKDDVEGNCEYWHSTSRKRDSLTAHMPPDSGRYYYPQVEKRIEDVKDYLVDYAAKHPMDPPKGQRVINTIEAVLRPNASDTSFSVDLYVVLSAPGKNMQATVTTKSGASAVSDVFDGSVLKMTLDGYQPGDSLSVAVEGRQELDAGVYFFEPKTPAGTDPRDVSQNLVGLSSGEIPFRCEATLSPTTLKIRKIDDKGKPLANVAFRLTYVSDNPDVQGIEVGTYDVDANGLLTLEHLMAGATYQLQEIETPAGYGMLTSPVVFRVTEGKNPQIVLVGEPKDVYLENGVLVLKNYEVPLVALPKTGDDSLLAAWLAAAGVALAMMLLLSMKKMRE